MLTSTMRAFATISIFLLLLVLGTTCFAVVTPGLMISDGVNQITIDQGGNVTFSPSCNNCSTAMVAAPSGLGYIYWGGTIGNFTVPGIVALTKPNPHMDVSLQSITSSGPGTLTISWTDVNFQIPDVQGVAINAGGTADPASVSYTAYVDNGNAPFGTGVTVGTLGPFSGTDIYSMNFNGSLVSSGPDNVPNTVPFSMTEVLTLTFTDAGMVGGDFDANALPSALALACPSSTGQVDQAYSSSLVATGGVPPYIFSVSGSLPDGLSLNTATGQISGTPTTAGNFGFSAQVADSQSTLATTLPTQCSITTLQQLYQISGCAYSDINRSMTFDSGDTALANVQISLTPYDNSTSSCQAAPLTTTTTAADGSYQFPGMVAGKYCLSAPNNAGVEVLWTGTPLKPSLPDSQSATGDALNNCFGYVPGPSATCVVINAIQGTPITPVKMTGSGGVGGPYTFSATGLPDGLVMATDGTISGTPNVSGVFNYTVTVTDVNHNQGSINCSVTVTEKLVFPGHIIVRKITNPPSAQSFSFASSYAASFPLSNGLSMDSGGLPAGAGYWVSEVLPAGWDQTSATCDNNNNPNNITVVDGQTVTCTFFNTQRGHIIVKKVTFPSSDTTTSFGFTSNYGNGFSLKNGGSSDSGTLAPGSYNVSETGQAGWTLTNVSCDNGSLPNAINLQAGQTVTCTFTNTQQGHIIVKKVTVPSSDTTTSFGFTSNYGNGFSLKNGGSNDSGTLAPGSYNVSETGMAGWTLINVSCDNGGLPSAINLQAGQTVTCTFTNTKLATLVVVKKTTTGSGDGAFTFTGAGAGVASSFSLTTSGGSASKTFSNLAAAGGYSVAETVPAGWMQNSVVCADSSTTYSPTAITLKAGQTVTCTFTNSKLATLIVVKQTASGSGDGSFTFTTSGSGLSNFSLATSGGSASKTFTNLKPNSGYAVVETVPSGWVQASAKCSDGSPINSISLSPGEVLTCTIVNTKPLVSYTQGGWGATPNGNNVATLLANNFGTLYPKGVSIGGNGGPYTGIWTSSTAVAIYLPSGGTAGAFITNYKNASSTTAGVLASQTIALRFNVDFSNAGVINNGLGFANLKLTNKQPYLNGYTVSQVLSIANTAIGGGPLPSGITYGILATLLGQINGNFDPTNGANWNAGYLTK